MVQSNILGKMRKLNGILQTSGATQLSFKDLCSTMMNILDSNVYVVSRKGKILGSSIYDEDGAAVVSREGQNLFYNEAVQEKLLRIGETQFNLTEEKLMDIFEGDIESFSKFVTIVPVIGNAQRLGTFIIASKSSYLEEDLILAEYAATIIGLEIIRAKSDEHEEVVRKKSILQMAISTLSYSEFEAIVHIFDELKGQQEGLLVASKIADKAGITRSVIVNALRKFESAGVIETRSLGMKGTHIKILNDCLAEELEKLR